MTDIATEINKVVADGYPDYNQYSYTANNIILFKDKTLNQWTLELETPMLPTGASISDLETYNFKILKLNEVVFSNLSFAKATLATSKMLYKRKLDEQKASLFEQYQAEGKRLSIDAAEAIAKRNLADIMHAYEISDMFFEYWEAQFQKIQLVNDRLTSLNILKNHEVKVGRHV